MFVLIAVVIALIVSVITSLVFSDKEKARRTALNCLLILAVAIVVYGYCDYRGMFGDPGSLDGKACYAVLSVTPIGKNHMVVILCDGRGEIVPIEFAGPVTTSSNGFYTVVGEHGHKYTLVPIK